jgi:hypothetical protein
LVGKLPDYTELGVGMAAYRKRFGFAALAKALEAI